jgi:hypothetical protein
MAQKDKSSFPWLIWFAGPVTLGVAVASVGLGTSKPGFFAFFLLTAFGHAVSALFFLLRCAEGRWHLRSPTLWALVLYWISFATMVTTTALRLPDDSKSVLCKLLGVALDTCLLLVPGIPLVGGASWFLGRRHVQLPPDDCF